MTFARRRNRLTTHFSEGNPVVKRRISVYRRLQSHATYSCAIVYYLAASLGPHYGTSSAQRHTLRPTGCSSYCAHSNKLANFVTILHNEHDGTVGRLFYTNLHSLLIGQWGPKRVGVCVLKHYSNSNKVSAFFGHTVTVATIRLLYKDTNVHRNLEPEDDP